MHGIESALSESPAWRCHVIIQFDTTFEKKAAVETVTPMLESDGAWRVCGYYVK